jgi:Lar family restriction alleviation protein
MRLQKRNCPFCGNSEQAKLLLLDVDDHLHVVRCSDCGSVGPQEETREQAISTWNTRASDHAQRRH